VPDKQAGSGQNSLLTQHGFARLGTARAWGLAGAAGLFLTPLSPVAAAEKHFGLTSFHQVELHVDADVEIVHRSPVAAMASGDQAALDRLDVEARDGRLIIRMRQYAGDERRANRREPLCIKISASGLRSLSIMGGGRVQVDRLSGPTLSLSLFGPGVMRVGQVTADRLKINMIGNGQLQLAGRAKQAEMLLAGASQVAGADLRVDDLTLQNDGAGDHQVTAVKRANITARGAGRVLISGQPSCTVQNAGSGTVQCGR
jgi:hypothetical protein